MLGKGADGRDILEVPVSSPSVYSERWPSDIGDMSPVCSGLHRPIRAQSVSLG